MSWEAQGLPVFRVELWHGLLVLASMALAPLEWVEPGGLLLGGLFMGVNFLLLAVGVRWVITPFASRGRVRAGVALLILKFCFLLSRFFHGMLARGVYLPPSQFEALFVSLAHGGDDIAATVAAFADWAAEDSSRR